MIICNDDHQEICYMGHACPLCAALEEHDNDVVTLNREIDQLKTQLADCEDAAREAAEAAEREEQ